MRTGPRRGATTARPVEVEGQVWYEVAKRQRDRVRLVKGLRGTQAKHRLSVRALGLNKLNDVRELKDSPQVRGLINKVYYLVRVEE